MSALNTSVLRPAGFILMGFPGIEHLQHWLSIPFTVLYITALVGNSTIILVVKFEQHLHTPMYVFLSMLAFVDIGLCTAVLPKILEILWLNSKDISFEGCFIQMFFIYMFVTLESSILVMMAYDRYVAICNPLRYTTILSKTLVCKAFVAFFIRDLVLTGLIPTLASRLPYCSSVCISHCYCDHMAVAKLACTNIIMNNYYGLFVALSILGVDAIFVGFSYIMIFRAVLKLGSKGARLKALNTCGSHLFVIMYFYIISLFNYLVYRFGKDVPVHVHVVFGVLYLLIPPVLNPMVYAVRTKEIRHAFLRHFLPRKIDSDLSHR
ncbi:olfactory receptor 52E4-like [Amia ocellicauda]|uniref:olfactory receptor 52E4-like n=1 Tax=Amia ocellicauda TaxID=2972642 RepID=UPI003463EFE1|nr:O52E4 protein [Amia calva]